MNFLEFKMGLSPAEIPIRNQNFLDSLVIPMDIMDMEVGMAGMEVGIMITLMTVIHITGLDGGTTMATENEMAQA